jgi:hypothetical protein
MYSKQDDNDHLYDFNATPGNLMAPGTSLGPSGRAPMTAYRGGAGSSSLFLYSFPFLLYEEIKRRKKRINIFL